MDGLGILELEYIYDKSIFLFLDEETHLFGYLPRLDSSHFFVIDLKNCKLDSIVSIPSPILKTPVVIFSYNRQIYYFLKLTKMDTNYLQKTQKLEF